MLLPFLTTSAFVFVYRALQAPPEYIGFVVLGGAMTAFWVNVMWMMAAQLYWEKDQGNLDIYITSPVSMMSRAPRDGLRRTGRQLAAGARSCLASVRFIYGVVFTVDQWVLLFAVFVLTLGRAVRARA